MHVKASYAIRDSYYARWQKANLTVLGYFNGWELGQQMTDYPPAAGSCPSALHAGRSTGVAPRGPLHGGVADLFYTDVRSILMVLLAFQRPALKTSFTWDRNRLFDEDLAELLADTCKESNEATVTSVRGRGSSKLRPIGMTTTSMQMIASRKFRFAPAHSLQVAEGLYTKGEQSVPHNGLTLALTESSSISI